MAQENETVITRASSLLPDTDPSETLCLVEFYGQNLGKRYFLNQSEILIGRSERCAIMIEQDSISRQHAMIRLQGSQATVADLKSTNGTFINNQRLPHAHERRLVDGDLLRVGQTIFKYLSGSNIESKYHEEIYRLSTIDGLTQCYNKRFFIESLDKEMNRSTRYNRYLSLLLLDIDHFKKINDTYGHLAGDSILRELANLINQKIRRDDVFARYGGEEFALIFPELDLNNAMIAADKLRSMIEAYPFVFNKQHIPVTVSLGLTSLEVLSQNTPEKKILGTLDFIGQADKALYQAKRNGRNALVSYGSVSEKFSEATGH